MKLGEQEREALRIETQRLRDELGDLRVEAEIKSEKLRHAEVAAERQRLRKPTPLDPAGLPSRSPASENSPTTTTSSPTVATPLTKSASSVVSETPTPPSPPTSETSLPIAATTPGLPIPKSRLSITKSMGTAPHPLNHPSRPPRHSRGPSVPTSIRSIQSTTRRNTFNRQDFIQNTPTASSSGSLHQIRGLIGKMQKLEQRVNSARSKLPAPTSTPPRGSPRSGSALGEAYIPPTVTMRSNKKRTGGSDASNGLQSPASNRPPSRLSFGIPQPSPSPLVPSPSRPTSRASISSRSSASNLPSAAPSSNGRPGSRQSVSRAPTPQGHYANSTLSESRRPRSSISGSYSATHQGGGHGYSASVNRLSTYNSSLRKNREEESQAVLTPTPTRRSVAHKGDLNSGLSALFNASKKKLGEAGATVGRRTSSGPGVRGREDGNMGPPERKRLSGVGETF